MGSQNTGSIDNQSGLSKKEAYYFSHDANARNDIKIMGLRRRLGWEAYGLYWALIEILREQPEFKLLLDSIDTIAYELHSTSEIIGSIVNDYLLFEIEGEFFYSARLSRSMTMYNELRNRRKEAGKKGGFSKALAMLQQSPGNATATLQQPSSIKGKESKGNESKVNQSRIGFEKPTVHDLTNEFSEKKLDDFTAMGEANKFFNYYESIDWHVGKHKMKNWKAAVSNWVSKMNNSNGKKNSRTASDFARPGTVLSPI